MAWGIVGRGFGVDELIWSESPVDQLANGVALGLLLGIILFLRYVLDPGRDRFQFRASLLTSNEESIRKLGQFLFIFWIPSLLILSVPVLFSERSVTPWPLIGGQAISVLLVAGIVFISSRLGIRACLQNSWCFRIQPAIKNKSIPEEEQPLHALALLFAILFLVALIVIYGLHFAGVILPAIVILCVILGLFNGIYGYIAFQFRGLQIIFLAGIVLLAVFANSDWANSKQAYKLQFPNMGDYYKKPVELFQTVDEVEKTEVDRYFKLLKDQEENPESAPKLLNTKTILEKRKLAWQKEHGDDSKPPLVIIATTGGGIRAAVWTALVLECLEMKVDGFRDRIQLFTGASGGMVGAGLYVTDFERGKIAKQFYDPNSGYSLYSTALAMDSLTPTVQTMLLSDLPSVWYPGTVSWDRGKALEEAWHHNLSTYFKERTGKEQTSPLQASFEKLKKAEAEGKIPSLIYSPMMIEDGRRLLISNLDLLDLTWTWGDALGFAPFKDHERVKQYALKKGMPDKPLRSTNAMEFFRLFPKATNFQVATAARMNASFPIVSPAVSLPTNPPRRVVDAGYYDNTGVSVAMSWLHRYRKEIIEHTSGVALIQIRAYRNGKMRRRIQAEDKKKKDNDGSFLQWLLSPGEGVLTARNSTAFQRNDERIAMLQEHFNPAKMSTGEHPFFTTTHIECQADANLSWILSEGDKKNIVSELYLDTRTQKLPKHLNDRVTDLQKWMKAPKRELAQQAKAEK